jgi:hypothetical protein
VAKRREQRSGAGVRLQGLYEAGDWRRARAGARRLAEAGTAAGTGARTEAGARTDAERELAAEILRRLRPEPGAVAAAAAGVVLLGIVAALGLLGR